MKHASSKQAVVVWLFLVIATLCTGWLVDHNGLAGKWTVAVVMFVALLKARAIILYYMEIKFAPLKLRLIFETWAVGASLIIFVFWLLQNSLTT